MLPEAIPACALWELEPPTVPPHSRLFHLTPAGMGTPWTESLTGYVARLAEAHGVRVRDLVLQEILPLLDRPHLAATHDPDLLSAFWRNETRALNGTRILAQGLVRALEQLTGRRDLRFLTLLTWTEILPVQQLQRPWRAWCPACYAAWRQAGEPVREPLLWTLAPMTICGRHGRPLEERCPVPACRRWSPVLGGRSRPGHCARCGTWLGHVGAPAEPGLTPEDLRAHRWIEDVLGELLAAAPATVPPRREHLLRAIGASTDALTGGNRRRWARRLGIGVETAVGWRAGRTTPALEQLLRLSAALGTTPLRLLQGDLGDVDRPTAHRLPHPLVPRRPRRNRTPAEQAALHEALEALLAQAEQPPPSLRAIAARLGETPSFLRRHEPDLGLALSARYLAAQQQQGGERRAAVGERVRQAVYAVHAQGQYPSAHAVEQRLGEPAIIINSVGRAAWRAALQELGWRA